MKTRQKLYGLSFDKLIVYSIGIVKQNNSLKEPRAPIATSRDFPVELGNIPELCWKAPRSCDCHVLIMKWRFWFIKKFTELISISSFLIWNTQFYWQKNLVKRFDIPIKHVIFCWYKNKHGCRHNRICMHVMLLQILWKITGYFFVLYFFYLNRWTKKFFDSRIRIYKTTKNNKTRNKQVTAEHVYFQWISLRGNM